MGAVWIEADEYSNPGMAEFNPFFGNFRNNAYDSCSIYPYVYRVQPLKH